MGIIVAGGRSRHAMFGAAGSRMSSVERYDVEKNEWVEMDGLPRFRGGCVGFLVGNGEEMEFWVMVWYADSPFKVLIFDPLLVAQFEIRQKNIDGARSFWGMLLEEPQKTRAYIDFEISKGNMKEPHNSIEGLLDRTKHLKVWISFAKFEIESHISYFTPSVLKMLVNHLRTSATELKEERAIFVGVVTMESSFGDIGDVDIVQNKFEEAQKEERDRFREDGPHRYEEYYYYIFPEEIAPRNLKILDAYNKWKKQKFSHTEE
ncbi:hypothetical protein IFM89_002147 [Coptis chinensis]|uniref:F-box/kelch-repeat protein n=1 Tax=Coptis chinensis TaxID=261450 RepID=A0A835GWU2_9MAGN|nr:hypothetical protein IFM89_002147 [Coptis chinensis]